MQAGVTWGRYIGLLAVGFASMLAGSQTVHYYFKPLADLENLIEEEVDNLVKNHGYKRKMSLEDEIARYYHQEQLYARYESGEITAEELLRTD